MLAKSSCFYQLKKKKLKLQLKTNVQNPFLPLFLNWYLQLILMIAVSSSSRKVNLIHFSRLTGNSHLRLKWKTPKVPVTFLIDIPSPQSDLAERNAWTSTELTEIHSQVSSILFYADKETRNW